MELPKDLVSRLLADGRGRPCLVKALLLLDPEDLKACRLVCSAWNEFIEEEVWSSQAGRSSLTKKLVNRWKTTNPETVQLGTVPRELQAIFCNNSHVFCGMGNGKVRVYNMTDGQWVRDLESGEEGLVGVGSVCGGESIVAARLGGYVVTVWSSKEEMGRLHSFDVRNHEGMDWVDDIKVTGNKVVLLLTDGTLVPTLQLVVLQEGENNWENKILEPFSTPIRHIKLAVDKDWWAVAGREESRSDIFKVKLWKDDLFRRDIHLPGISAGVVVEDVVLESPLLVVGGRSRSGGRSNVWIKVFQLAADNLMEDLNSAASLIKTVQLPGFYFFKLLSTNLVLGCLMGDADEFSLVLFEKTALLDGSTLPEQTPRNRIHPGTEPRFYNLVDMNTTSVVFIQQVTGQDNQWQNYLCKKDFWISRANTA